MNSVDKQQPSLCINKALELISLSDGILAIADLPMLSLPCVMEKRQNDLPVIVTHFERSRDSYITAIEKNPFLRIQFVVGFHYIDPTWIPRQPHAPTEVKAVFEFSGKASLIDRPNTETLAMLNSVTLAKQKIYAPESKWSVFGLPQDYLNPLFPKIVELEIEPEKYNLSRLMVLSHLSEEHRQIVISKLKSFDTPCSKATIRLFEIAYK